ncbi:hypothetical protein SUGI_0852800 [Cryptomeria japonica]|nr:hypothetical protein SUGI_0852800 [Cryptomeria japonica]
MVLPAVLNFAQRKWGQWVSEIREPMKKKRIWLGSFPTLEMDTSAHDATSLSLRGVSTGFNFPELAHFLPLPATSSATDIQVAAVQTANCYSFTKKTET